MWDAECESLYKTFLQSPQGDDSSLTATALLAKLDRKRRDRWSEAVRSIDFSHSSRKAWSILNNFTGRSRHSPLHCPVSANAIASQLVRNEKYKAVDRKSSRLVFQEVSDLIIGAVFIDLTAAYDTVWHRGLTCKLLRLLPDKHMVKMIMELVRNRSFTLTTGDSKQSRLRRLKNGVPQGSVLAPLLFNIYTYDLPSMISKKFAYADDLALLQSSGNWKDLEGTLSQDMSTLSAYLQTWRLKLSHTKTVTAAFHLNNREAKRELKVYNNGRLLPFRPTPTYLTVKLDRSLTFRHHLVALRKKLSSRVTLLR